MLKIAFNECEQTDYSSNLTGDSATITWKNFPNNVANITVGRLKENVLMTEVIDECSSRVK